MRTQFKLLLLVSLLFVRTTCGQISGAGQLGCSASQVTGTVWNSSTSNNTTQTLLTGVSAAAALVQLDQTTTITGGAVTFQLSYDGTNFVTAPLVVNNATGVVIGNPYALQASTNKTFLVPLAGATILQLQLTTVLTGTGAVTPYTTALCTMPLMPLTVASSQTNPVYVSTSVPVPIAPLAVPIALRPQIPLPVLTNINPCQTNVGGDVAISQAATGQILTGRPGLRILVCYERIVAGATEQISEMEGTGSNCATGTVFHSGSSTAANGEPLAANGGFVNVAPFYLLPGNNYCIQQAGTARIAGKINYLYVP